MRIAPSFEYRLRCLLSAGVFLFLGLARAQPQAVNEYQVKAAYLYNFAKFVEWPASDFANPASPFQFCVVNDSSFVEELTRTVNGKMLAGRTVGVVPVSNTQQARTCHVLFISSSVKRQSEFIKSMRGTNVLTVGETNGFVEEGGMMNFVLQDNRVQFQVNHKAATEAGLRISSRLLNVAKQVIE